MKALNYIVRKLALVAVVLSVGLVATGCGTLGGASKKSVDELISAANSGDPHASLKLGEHFMKAKNHNEATKWYKKAEEQFKVK